MYRPREGSRSKCKELMGSDLFQNHNQESCGLAKYRSAPGSFLASLLEPSTENGSSGDESEAFFSALMDSGPLDLNQKNNDQMQYFLKKEFGRGKNEISTEQMGYEGAAASGSGGAVVGSYSVGTESQLILEKGDNVFTNLARQNSSPAGIFPGFGATGDPEMRNYRVQNHAETNSSATGLVNHLKFSPPPSSVSRFIMPRIPESGNESIDVRIPGNGGLRNCNGLNGREFDSSLPHGLWNDQSPFNNLKRSRDGEPMMFSNFSGLENLNEESGKKSSGLVRHLSLSKTSAPMADAQKYLHFQQDSTIPCQVRAKRGFATHPRSIAERMRRTKISEKMKKLQDLFPDMDKQATTADMLDLSVQYIKELQKQVKTLTTSRAKCICSSKHKPTSSATT